MGYIYISRGRPGAFIWNNWPAPWSCSVVVVIGKSLSNPLFGLKTSWKLLQQFNNVLVNRKDRRPNTKRCNNFWLYQSGRPTKGNQGEQGETKMNELRVERINDFDSLQENFGFFWEISKEHLIPFPFFRETKQPSPSLKPMNHLEEISRKASSAHFGQLGVILFGWAEYICMELASQTMKHGWVIRRTNLNAATESSLAGTKSYETAGRSPKDRLA
jgi:hypothetical protein